MLSNSRPLVSGITKRTKNSVRIQNAPYMIRVSEVPAALRRDRKVSEIRKFEVPKLSVAAATPRPRTRKGKTSETIIQAIGPILKA
jgi:hypothetical protein